MAADSSGCVRSIDGSPIRSSGSKPRTSVTERETYNHFACNTSQCKHREINIATQRRTLSEKSTIPTVDQAKLGMIA